MFGINFVIDSMVLICVLLEMFDVIIQCYEIFIQVCVLIYVISFIEVINCGVLLDLVFQLIVGIEVVNVSFGISLKIFQEGYEVGFSQKCGILGNNLMYFEIGQGSVFLVNVYYGVDQQICEICVYVVVCYFKLFLVNIVVGFIGFEYLYNGKQIICVGLEDYFCGKLFGVLMGCDICYINYVEVDQDDMDMFLILLGVVGINFIMGIFGFDDVMFNYQIIFFYDVFYVCQMLGLKLVLEFEDWLQWMGIFIQVDGCICFGDELLLVFCQVLV